MTRVNEVRSTGRDNWIKVYAESAHQEEMLILKVLSTTVDEITMAIL